MFANSTKVFLARKVRQVVASLNFPSVAAAASTTLTVAVPGAAVGDTVIVNSAEAGGPTAGLTHTAWVSAAAVVTVRVTNTTAGAIDQAAHSYLVTVLRRGK
jgi:hypothetical protein